MLTIDEQRDVALKVLETVEKELGKRGIDVRSLEHEQWNEVKKDIGDVFNRAKYLIGVVEL